MPGPHDAGPDRTRSRALRSADVRMSEMSACPQDNGRGSLEIGRLATQRAQAAGVGACSITHRACPSETKIRHSVKSNADLMARPVANVARGLFQPIFGYGYYPFPRSAAGEWSLLIFGMVPVWFRRSEPGLGRLPVSGSIEPRGRHPSVTESAPA